MLHRPKSRVLMAGVALLSLSTQPGPAPADTIYETVYLPTSEVVGLPTSRVLSTSYVIPTVSTSSVYVPTSYVSTSSYLPTSYVSTSYLPTSAVVSSYDPVLVPTSTTYYRRSILRPRRYVERTRYSYLPTSYLMPSSFYLPTSYVVPTTSIVSSSILPTSYVIDNGVITTSASSSLPCETSTTPMPTKATASRPSNANGNTITSEPTNGAESGERKPSATVNSAPPGEDPIPSNVQPPVIVPSTPPAVPVPEKDAKDAVPVPRPGEASGTPPGTNETALRRNSLRPSYDVRNILRGRVISAESKLPLEGVTIIVSSLTKNFGDRPAMSDADGEFKVSLPDGDWTVKVKMPSGSIYTVGRDYVTASNGRVTDPSGRNVGEFLITR